MSDFDNWAPSSSPLFNVVTRSKCPRSVFCNIEKGERGCWLSTKKMLLKLRKNVDRKRLFCSNVSTLLSMIVGRPAFPLNMVVPSFISTLKFANPLMPLSVSSPSVIKVSRTVHLAMPPCSHRLCWTSHSLLVWVFRLSRATCNFVAQIVAGKYIDLSNFLPVNLVQREPEPQLLFGGQLVLTSQAKKTAGTKGGHCFVNGGLCHLFSHPDLTGKISCSTSC